MEFIDSICSVPTLPSEDPHPTCSSSSMGQKLTCPICENLLNRPVQLSCDKVVCATCLSHEIQKSFSLKCPCCSDHMLSSSTISRPSAFLLSVWNDLQVTCVRKCGKAVKVQHYQQHLDGNCKSHYIDLSSPSKVTLRDVLSKSSSSPATSAEMMATHHLVRRVLNQQDGPSSTSNVLTVPTGGQVSLLKIISINNYSSGMWY